MGIFDRSMSSRGFAKSRDAVPMKKQQFRTTDFVGDLTDTSFRDRVQKEDLVRTYDENAWVYSGVNRIAIDIASLKLKIFKIVDGVKIEVTDDPRFVTITSRANEFMTAYDLWECTNINLDLTGESFWEKVPNEDGFITSLFPIQSQSVEPVPDPKGFVSGFWFRDSRGGRKLIAADKIVYMKNYSPLDDFRGQGSISAATAEIILNINGLVFGRRFFDNSAMPHGVITVDQELDDADFERMRSMWNEAHRGLKESSKVAVLDAGMKFEEIGATQQDMQFLDQLQLSSNTILSTIGVPPSVAGRFETAIRANAETQELSYWTHTIRPRIRKFESFLGNFLVPSMYFGNGSITSFFETKFEVQFDLSEVDFLQNRALGKLEVMKGGMDRGAVTPNEYRQALQKVFPDIPFESLPVGGDVTTLLQNLQQAGFATPQRIDQEGIITSTKNLNKQEEEIGLVGAIDVTSPEIGAFILASQAERITVDLNIRGAIQEVFAASAEAGEDVSALSARLQLQFTEFNQVRALRIARTEVLGNANFGALEGFRQSGLDVRKQWLTAGDANVRGNDPKDNANHVALEGEIRGLNELFSNGLKFPGDQSAGKAEEVANCRCTLLPKVMKFKASKKVIDNIMKQQQARMDAFEVRLTTVLQDMFAVIERGVLADVAAQETFDLFTGAEIATNNVPLGITNEVINSITEELLIISANDGLAQVGRVS